MLPGLVVLVVEVQRWFFESLVLVKVRAGILVTSEGLCYIAFCSRGRCCVAEPRQKKTRKVVA